MTIVKSNLNGLFYAWGVTGELSSPNKPVCNRFITQSQGQQTFRAVSSIGLLGNLVQPLVERSVL